MNSEKRNVIKKVKEKNNFLGILVMSKPGKSLKGLCKKLGVRLTVKRNGKRVYKSVVVLKRQCAKKQKKKKVKRKRKRRFGSYTGEPRMLYKGSMLPYSEIQKLEKQRRFKENLEGYVKTGGRKNNKRIPLALKNKEYTAGEIVMNMPLDNTSGHYILQSMILGHMGSMNMHTAIEIFKRARAFLQTKMAIPGGARKNLQGINLCGANLFNANLGRANLQDADLRLSQLQDANLNQSHLEGANLSGSNLENADMYNSHLEGAVLYKANLLNAHITLSDLERADLQEADLRNAILQGSTLERANLQYTNLGGANLVMANLRGANLRGANLEGATYDSETEFPEEFNPQERGMVRVHLFGKKRKKRKKRKRKK